MIKTFFIGLLLGLIAAAGALYALPAVDQHRESSIISVAPNGANSEIFHVVIPSDRILVGGIEQPSVPEGVVWPDDELLAGVTTELYKIRNANETVVGIATRMVAKEDDTAVLDWVIHLPARGSLYFNMDNTVAEGGYRIGDIRAGSREFSGLGGAVFERWVADSSGDQDAPQGRIELTATYISHAEQPE